MASKVAMACME